MAYAATVTVTRKGSEILVTVSETEAASGSEATITIGVTKFRVHRQICTLSSGSGASVDPILGRATSPSGANVILDNDAAAATADNSVTGGVTGYSSDGILYHRSKVNTGTDNTVVSEYHLTVGW